MHTKEQIETKLRALIQKTRDITLRARSEFKYSGIVNSVSLHELEDLNALASELQYELDNHQQQ